MNGTNETSVVKYLQTVFGKQLFRTDYQLPPNIPIYLKSDYDYSKIIWEENDFVIITPNDSAIRLPVPKKQYYKIKEIIGFPCALNIRNLSAAQRENLIQEKIPFVSEKRQIYLPFWGAVFMENLRKSTNIHERMTPTTQLIYLYIYYYFHNSGKKINSVMIRENLNIPKTSISRAIQELQQFGLICCEKEGTIKWIYVNDELSNAMKYLQSPVSKTFFLKSVPHNISCKIGDIRGLEKISMISANDSDGALVYNQTNAKKIPSDLLIDKRTFEDFGGYKAEVWKYDPALLSEKEIVDEISLLLCLQNNIDERIQKELDSIRERYDL